MLVTVGVPRAAFWLGSRESPHSALASSGQTSCKQLGGTSDRVTAPDAGVQLVPLSRLISGKTSKKLLKRLVWYLFWSVGDSRSLPSDCRVGLSRIMTPLP